MKQSEGLPPVATGLIPTFQVVKGCLKLVLNFVDLEPGFAILSIKHESFSHLLRTLSGGDDGWGYICVFFKSLVSKRASDIHFHLLTCLKVSEQMYGKL